MKQHNFYTADDFKDDDAIDYDSTNSTYHYVVECGFQICKDCGDAEGSLQKYCTG